MTPPPVRRRWWFQYKTIHHADRRLAAEMGRASALPRLADVMSEITVESQSGTDMQPGLRSLVKAYETPSLLKSSYQIATSIGLFIAGCASMYWSLHVSRSE